MGLCFGGIVVATVDRLLRGGNPRAGLSLVFDDDFDDPASIDLDGSNGAAKWFTDLPWREERTPARLLRVADSVLTIDQEEQTGNWAIATRSPWTGNGRSFRHGYFEARMAFEPEPDRYTDGFPAFWALPVSQQDFTPERHYAEIDFFEAVTEPGQRYDGHFTGVVHDIGLNEQYEQSYRWINTNNRSERTVVRDTGWHSYGCRWEPGRLRWYFDDRLMHQVDYSANGKPSCEVMKFPDGSTDGPSGLFHIADEGSDFTVVLGTGPGWPLRIDWVRVWA